MGANPTLGLGWEKADRRVVNDLDTLVSLIMTR